MGILSALFNQSFSRANPSDPVIASWFGGSSTRAGVAVTPERAMQLMPVYACVRIIAESIAVLPLHLYQRGTKNGRPVSSMATNHPLYPVLHNQPNKWQTSFEWREMLTAFAALRGNAYAEIIPVVGGPIQLIPLHPDRVRPFRGPDGLVHYWYQPMEGPSRVILSDEMFHLRGLSSDGMAGIDPITLARESLGLTIAAEEFGAAFYGNGTVIGGVLEHPGQLSDEAYARLKNDWNEKHQGPASAHKPAILESGMKWQSIGIEPEKAQFLESRRFQIAEVARLFRVPPHMIADLSNATFSNIEHQGIEFVTHTITPWAVRWEQAITRCLLTDAAKRTIYPRFNLGGLLRGDTLSRYTAYQIAAGGNAPWLTRNEIRELEDRNPLEGLDDPVMPLNMQKANEPAPAQNTQAQAVVRAAAERVARKEAAAGNKAFDSKHIEFIQAVLAVMPGVAAKLNDDGRAFWQDAAESRIETDHYITIRTDQIVQALEV